MEENMGLFSRLAHSLGAPEAAFRLVVSLLLGYPLLLVHRHLLYRKNPTLQHLYFIICGMSIGIFNNGMEIYHSMICVFVCWLGLVVGGGSQMSVIFANIFQMGYLLVGYYMTATTSYDIKWTMPHCVLTLRLIALTWDLYDGIKDKSLLSAEQAQTALSECPSLLEVAAHTYFPASYMVGPQFNMKRYLDFTHGRLFSSYLPNSLLAGFTRGALGLFFMAVFQVSSVWLKEDYLVSDEFAELSLLKKAVYVALWGKVTLYKYNSCWLIVEGVCIISGLSYNGRDSSSGLERWDACKNIKVTLFEKAFKFYHIIESFNVNTNVWVAKYVYKRMKFLNNRNVSTFTALMFLAVWHGLHSGYYVCFFLEFLITYFERSVESLLKKYPKLQEQLDLPLVKPLRLVLMKFYLMVFFGYSLAPFVLLKSYRWWTFFKSTYFIGHIFFGGWVLYRPLVVMALDAVYGKPVKEKSKEPHPEPPASTVKQD
ncbi:lysophospholipid acyltransferase 5 isoform X1 [Hyalella azteca]|uniref:Lysophospholipid acyltransferase 5 n=1 Tax=Hyalella azteca TaxID=294128 RepID=A0A8B7NTM8_HYAAZ|nr:lysophospholipid acyltransferase 5 isoform X1 [Hyalella azteca]